MLLSETILALSSPPNTGGGDGTRGILRIAGPAALDSARTAIPTLPQTPGHHPNLTLPLLHPTLKIASALLFLAPRSFTGDDLVELHLPNSPALLRAVTDQILTAHPTTTRLATPGEFSARAFFNRKIDLTQAEGIAATISANSQIELRAAASLRAGHLYKWTADFTEKIANLLASVEAGIDFSDEEGVSFIDPGHLGNQLFSLAHALLTYLESSVRIDRLDALPTIAFVGDPNVGKSSLINTLTGIDRSIVSPLAGTTRDMLAAIFHTSTGDIRLLDVPGKEEPTDELKQKMMAARDAALLDADLIIEVITDNSRALASFGRPDGYPAGAFVVQNKADLLPPEELTTTMLTYDTQEPCECRWDWQLVSAKTGYKIPELRTALQKFATRRDALSSCNIVLNHRHRALLQQAKSALMSAGDIAFSEYPSDDSEDSPEPTTITHPELLAADLRHALNLLGQITGAISPDEILGRIFSQFCIGK